MKSPTPCAQKQQADDAEMAKLVAKGTPVARMNTGIDGGMNKVFAAKLPDGNTGLSDGGEGQSLSLLALSRAPGTIPSHVNPPHAGDAAWKSRAVAAATPAPSTRMAAAAPSAPSGRILQQPRPQGRVRRLRRYHRKRAAAGRRRRSRK